MKKQYTIQTAAIVMCLGLCATVLAQRPAGTGGRPDGAGGPPDDVKPDPAVVAQHFVEAHAKIAPYDANNDGLLDGDERLAMGEAMANGMLNPPAHKPVDPEQVEHPGLIIARIGQLYSAAFAYDADKDGTLNGEETEKLKAAIEAGKLQAGGPRGGGRPGGPRGSRPE